MTERYIRLVYPCTVTHDSTLCRSIAFSNNARKFEFDSNFMFGDKKRASETSAENGAHARTHLNGRRRDVTGQRIQDSVPQASAKLRRAQTRLLNHCCIAIDNCDKCRPMKMHFCHRILARSSNQVPSMSKCEIVELYSIQRATILSSRLSRVGSLYSATHRCR